MSDAICANCEQFAVIDDSPRQVERWSGVCVSECVEALGVECETRRVLDWAYYNCRQGCDGCDRIDCFEDVDE